MHSLELQWTKCNSIKYRSCCVVCRGKHQHKLAKYICNYFLHKMYVDLETIHFRKGRVMTEFERGGDL